MKTKSIFLITISFLLVAVVIFGLGLKKEAPIDSIVTDIPENLSEENVPALEVESNKYTDEEKRAIEQEKIDTKDWITKGVLWSGADKSDYDSYDDATLEKMAIEGDLKATKVLWARLKKIKNKDVKTGLKQEALAEMAIIYGDQELLGHMPGVDRSLDRYLAASTEEEKRKVMIKQLAFAEFAGLRGNLGVKYSNQQQFLSLYLDEFPSSNLTNEEKAYVKSQANAFYNHYEKLRIAKGLGPFDNSVPEGITRWFDRQKKAYLENMGVNAIE